jgi:hypothetical protein
MSEVYFVVTDVEFTFDANKVNVIKCDDRNGVQQVMSVARSQGVNKIWVAKAISVEEKTIEYKAKML